MKLKISFLIPCYNEEKHILRLLKKLHKVASSDFMIEILVIDGNSNDGTQEIVLETSKKLNFEFCSIVLLENNLRLQAEALNIGLKAARYEFCVRIDSHLRLGSVKRIRSSLKHTFNILKSNKACSVGYKQRFSITNNLIHIDL